MGGSKQWAKSSNGPDWIDLRAMMTAIGGLHTASVEVVLSPDGIGSSGGMKVACAAHFDKLPGSALPETVEVGASWPTAEGRSITDVVYKLLWQLDYEISKVYEQEGLWK